MKLIEKKCPNCGASLEFDEKDKSCNCTYCHRSYEIEREETKEDIEYKLKELQEITKKLGPSPIFFIIPVIIFVGFAFLIYSIFSFNVKTDHDNFEKNAKESKENYEKKVKESEEKYNKEKEEKEKIVLLEDAKDITDSALDNLDHEAVFAIKNAKGNTQKTYFTIEERKRDKVYVAYKEGSNYFIAIYKVKYKDFFNQSDMQTIYVPLVYENVENPIGFYNVKVDAPEYYFTDAKDTYAYGYASFDEAYNNVVKPLESEYTITER